MKRFVCAVRDTAAQLFGSPIFVAAVAQAQRSFVDEVNGKAQESQMAGHPEDFELWVLSIFDDESGVFEDGKELPRLVCRGTDVRR